MQGPGWSWLSAEWEVGAESWQYSANDDGYDWVAARPDLHVRRRRWIRRQALTAVEPLKPLTLEAGAPGWQLGRGEVPAAADLETHLSLGKVGRFPTPAYCRPFLATDVLPAD